VNFGFHGAVSTPRFVRGAVIWEKPNIIGDLGRRSNPTGSDRIMFM
jgi:hypothetical protein